MFGAECQYRGVATPGELRSDRLLLRRWRQSDRDLFAAMNADPVVMEFYPSTLGASESHAMVDQIEATFLSEGLGLWAVEVPGTASFIGYVGLWPARFAAPFTPAIEVGWRLSADHWGHGYATEAAQVAVTDGFRRLGLTEIVSFTAAINHRSRRVMEKIAMTQDPREDFDHPAIPDGDPLQRHVLYRLAAYAAGPW
jgi:RimJ/RimL family protein N-acetyltransferase